MESVLLAEGSKYKCYSTKPSPVFATQPQNARLGGLPLPPATDSNSDSDSSPSVRFCSDDNSCEASSLPSPCSIRLISCSVRLILDMIRTYALTEVGFCA